MEGSGAGWEILTKDLETFELRVQNKPNVPNAL